MSDGHYCFLRDLGPVKGGKGLKHHEVIMHLTLRGLFELSRRRLVKMPSEGINEPDTSQVIGPSHQPSHR